MGPDLNRHQNVVFFLQLRDITAFTVNEVVGNPLLDFRDHPPIDLEHWVTLPELERAIRGMLEGVDEFRALPVEERLSEHTLRYQQDLAHKLETLYDRLHGVPLGPPPPRQI